MNFIEANNRVQEYLNKTGFECIDATAFVKVNERIYGDNIVFPHGVVSLYNMIYWGGILNVKLENDRYNIYRIKNYVELVDIKDVASQFGISVSIAYKKARLNKRLLLEKGMICFGNTRFAFPKTIISELSNIFKLEKRGIKTKA